MSEPQTTIAWEKKLDQIWTLREVVSDHPNTLNCTITNTDPDTSEEWFFAFSQWGMERDKITGYQCYIVCQGLLYEDANVALAGFKACFDHYQPYLDRAEPDDEDDDDADVCPLCNGVGDVEELLSECPDCEGSGYL